MNTILPGTGRGTMRSMVEGLAPATDDSYAVSGTPPPRYTRSPSPSGGG